MVPLLFVRFSPSGAGHVHSFFLSSDDPRKALFVSRGRSTSFHTTDMGQTYASCAPLDIVDVRLHPVNHNWLLASALSAGCAPIGQGRGEGDCFKTVRTNTQTADDKHEEKRVS